MRYLVRLMPIFAMLVLPLSASAQAGEDVGTTEPNLEEPAPSSEPEPEAPVLQIELDPAGVDVVPSRDRYVLEYSDDLLETVPVRRARKGLIGSAAALAVGGVLFGVSYIDFRLFATPDRPPPSWQRPVRVTGGVLMVGGAAGMIATGIVIGVRKRKLRSLQAVRYEGPRRIQWDAETLRLAF